MTLTEYELADLLISVQRNATSSLYQLHAGCQTPQDRADGYLLSGYVFSIYKRSMRFEGRYEVRDSDTWIVSVLNQYEGRCREL